MTNLPEGPKRPGGPEQPAGSRLSSQQFELVIRRAVELQARVSETHPEDGIDEAEVLRIGRELGLSPQNMHQALAEVDGGTSTESGALSTLFGPAGVRVARSIPGDAAKIASILEKHLVEKEYLSVMRRMRERTLFAPASGAPASVGRAMSKAFSRTPPLTLSTLEVCVRSLDDGYTFVSLASSLQGTRIATAGTSIVGGGWAGGALGAFLGIAITPLAALAGIPILIGAVFGGRAYYSASHRKAHIQLESLLDRLEHGDLDPKPTSSLLSLGRQLLP